MDRKAFFLKVFGEDEFLLEKLKGRVFFFQIYIINNPKDTIERQAIKPNQKEKFFCK